MAKWVKATKQPRLLGDEVSVKSQTPSLGTSSVLFDGSEARKRARTVAQSPTSPQILVLRTSVFFFF